LGGDKISDLSLHGCYVEMSTPFSPGTNVMIEIYTDDEFVESGRPWLSSRPGREWGLHFSELQGYFASVLSKWMERASKVKAN
jgi:hypothetical protein